MKEMPMAEQDHEYTRVARLADVQAAGCLSGCSQEPDSQYADQCAGQKSFRCVPGTSADHDNSPLCGWVTVFRRFIAGSL